MLLRRETGKLVGAHIDRQSAVRKSLQAQGALQRDNLRPLIDRAACNPESAGDSDWRIIEMSDYARFQHNGHGTAC